jgi:glycosyltransferase involved in cell wall biosynthesis
MVSLVIPALNEERNLEQLLPRLPAGVDELIVVDGRSRDRTVAVTRRLRPDALVLSQPGVGKGDALATGFAAASGAFVVMMDADGSNDPAEIPAFVAALRSGAGFAKGSRFIAGGGSSDITPVRALGNRVLRMVVNLLYGTRYTDLCYGFNAFRADCLRTLDVHCEGFEVEALISCQMARAGVSVEEVPSFERPRMHGASNLRPIRDGLRILRIVLRERLRRSLIAAVPVSAERPARG